MIDDISQDWLEFESNTLADENNFIFVNLKRSEISEVVQCVDADGNKNEKWTRIYMKNGRNYLVYMPYEKVMELV